jgi:hypothetical protein
LLGALFKRSLNWHLCTTISRWNTTENNCTISRAKHDCTSAWCICNWNTAVTGDREGTIGFL